MVKEEKKVKTKTKKETTKEVKAKDMKKGASKIKKKASNQGVFATFRSELKKIKWPTKKEMIKYSIATVAFVIFFAIFFYLIELLMALLKTLI